MSKNLIFVFSLFLLGALVVFFIEKSNKKPFIKFKVNNSYQNGNKCVHDCEINVGSKKNLNVFMMELISSDGKEEQTLDYPFQEGVKRAKIKLTQVVSLDSQNETPNIVRLKLRDQKTSLETLCTLPNLKSNRLKRKSIPQKIKRNASRSFVNAIVNNRKIKKSNNNSIKVTEKIVFENIYKTTNNSISKNWNSFIKEEVNKKNMLKFFDSLTSKSNSLRAAKDNK